jgi:hypothetical protein
MGLGDNRFGQLVASADGAPTTFEAPIELPRHRVDIGRCI